MKKKITYTILILFLLITTYGFSNWMIKEIFLSDNNNTETFIVYDVDCDPPSDLGGKDIKTDEITIYWTDTNNTNWEYYVQSAGGGEPTSGGAITTSKSVTVTRTNGTGGGNLQPNTEYEFWVRSTCGAGKNSGWIGPFTFRTPCNVQTLPFWEGFNTDSPTYDCWRIIDGNMDGKVVLIGALEYNRWFRTQMIQYEGDRTMFFSGDSEKHDDWLISPTFTLDPKKYYKLLYNYVTDNYAKTDFEIVLSNNGQAPSEFKKVLLAKTGHSDSDWKEQKIIIGGEGGDINIGWHVTTPSSPTALGIDNFFLEEIDCPEPWNLGSKDEEENKATIYWEDNFGLDWEYIVQKSGGAIPLPTTIGTATTTKEVVVDKDKNGDSLESNTEYEFYVRTNNCGSATNGEWSGPYKFRTICGVFTTPFWEGFNSNSESIFCWTILDNNNDGTSYSGQWIKYNSATYEGSHSMYFYVYKNMGETDSDDWLISPVIRFELGKIYRLKYHYKMDSDSSYDSNGLEILASNSGTKPIDFTTKIVSNKAYTNGNYIQQTVFISGLSGSVNLAWHVTSSTKYNSYIYIDNVFVEEVQGCPEPLLLTLGVKEEKNDRTTIFWDDEFGATDWEYYVQEAGGAPPTATGSGTATKSKENTVTQDGAGKALEANTDYEFYVRTDCGNGEFSIWQGPYQFTTACDIYTTPFWEGFNSDSKTIRCWTIIDGNGDSTSPTSNIWYTYKTASGVYEGDQSMYFYGSTGTHDDWLVSPTIEMDPVMYVLKYRYKTNSTASYNSSFEILLSSQGIDTTKFTTTILPTEVYQEGGWKEKVVFFTGIAGDVNLGWHVNSIGTTYVHLDDVTLKEVETCPEPYYVKVTDQTTTTMDIEWEQDGGITSWEVIVVDYGEDKTATPVQTVTVTGTPETTITGLTEGTAYTIYVRAKCTDGTSNSDWSTPVNAGTKVGANDDCLGAINIPVNNTLECDKTVSGTLLEVTASGAAPNTIPSCNNYLVNDVWFEFTATSDIHMLEVLDLAALPSTTLAPTLYIAIYDQSCTAMVGGGNPPIECYTVTATGEKTRILRDLTPGQQYYVRIGNYERTDTNDDLTDDQPDFIFKLCLTTSDKGFLEISPSGEKYSVEELINDVLIKTNCDLISNVRYQAGNGNNTMNTLAYFNRGNSDFPFEEGIVLATHNADYIAGPYRGFEVYKPRIPFWTGDPDLNEVIDEIGGSGFGSQKAVAVLEFDFIPVKDSIKFEYLFVSDSFNQRCAVVCRPGGALFAAWLTEIETGEGQNLALVPGTTDPIAISTIRDNEKSGANCESVNPEYYWKNYDNNKDNPLGASVNYTGVTVPISSETVAVKPGKKYHIKLAIADFCPILSDASAVFFNAGSFDIGDLDLGADLLVETNNALCGGECVTIHSGLGGDEEIDVDLEIQWYKDGVAIPGATAPDYEACESGTYKVVGKYAEINCEVEGEKVIEIYPAISTVVHKPEALETCRYSLHERIIDLSDVEAKMFADVQREDYKTSYYPTAETAEAADDDNMDTIYVVEGIEDRSVYIRVDDIRTGCHEVFVLPIEIERGATPNKPEDVRVCAEYVFPDVNEDQYYYTEPGGAGKAYKAGDVLAEPGKHTIYLLQVNSEEGCYEETAYQVNITAPVMADVFEDKTLSCGYYELAPLSEHNSYYTEPEGQGTELYEGMQILHKQTVYVYASSDDGLCTDESSFVIDYEDCPIPRGISPNNDGLNDVFDLTPHGVESIQIYNRWGTEVYTHGEGYTTQWHGQSKSGKQLPDGTYYYVIQAHGKTRTGWVQINK